MELQQVKSNLNKAVVYNGVKGVYRLTACVLRKGKTGYFYQAELQDTKHGNSVVICRLEDIEVEQ